MPLVRFLLLGVVLSLPYGLMAQSSHPLESGSLIASAGNLAPLDNSDTAHASRLTPPEISDLASPPENICYKIRAYIFKHDDDRAPEMVRSLTCGPRIPHTKNVTWPKGRLVPAN